MNILLSIVQFNALSYGDIVSLGVMLLLLMCSAVVSGSEVAFFSLSPSDIYQLNHEEHKRNPLVLNLLDHPKTLLATILIANNLINIGIVLLSSFLVYNIVTFQSLVLAFWVQVVVVTFIILLFGEVVPKVYATSKALHLARNISPVLAVLFKFFRPLSSVLISSTRFIENRLKSKTTPISVDDLGQALEITYQGEENVSEEEQKILKGIVQFSNMEVSQIMTPRVEVAAFDMNTPYTKVFEKILEYGYSRIPVYEQSFDKVKGILYIKDLLAYIDEQEVDWVNLIRPPYFIPENKKIDDLLQEFRQRKIHMAVVVDEYGGASGIVTLEDIIEEIVGEISDEYDDDEIIYSKLDDLNYVFEGKTQLVDIYRIMGVDGEEFESKRGDAGTIAGFLLELTSRIPERGEVIRFKDYRFTIEAADKRKIKRVKISIVPTTQGNEA